MLLGERLSSHTGGAALSMNEAGDIQITVDSDATTSAPPVVCSLLFAFGCWLALVIGHHGFVSFAIFGTHRIPCFLSLLCL